MAGIGLSRGSIVTVAMAGEYAKPRPAIVVQADIYSDLPSVIVVPVSSQVRDDGAELRVDITPSATNGLRVPSQALMDKITFVTSKRVGKLIGTAEPRIMEEITRNLAVILEIA